MMQGKKTLMMFSSCWSRLIYESLNLHRSVTRGERIHEQPRARRRCRFRKRKISTRTLQRRQQLRGSVLFAILGDCYTRYRRRSQVTGVPKQKRLAIIFVMLKRHGETTVTDEILHSKDFLNLSQIFHVFCEFSNWLIEIHLSFARITSRIR